ncbi:MAG: GMC family oxidoreductase [Saprospiraceae bacterium]
MKKYDVIIIGTGAGGGTIAQKLAPTGKKILILERGQFLPKEVDNWNPHVVYTEGKYRPKEHWYDSEGNPFLPFTHYCVGGNTKVYGAALLRLRERDFEETYHRYGVSPAWPVSYDEMEDYYQQAEQLYHVHGRRGSDPTEPKASKPYPFAEIPAEEDMARLNAEITSLGYHPSPIPIGISLPQDHAKINEAASLSYFDGYPDPTESKADSHVIGIKKALTYENVTLITGFHVQRLDTDASGHRVRTVCGFKNGQELEFAADTIIVSCGAINSAALLLKSKSAVHPKGLANSSGLVGRNLMLHNNGTVVAITKKKNNAQFQKSFLISDFYHGKPSFPYPMGTIQLMGKTDPDTLDGLLKDEFGENLPFVANDFGVHSIDFFITTEDLPDHDNKVEVREDGSIQLKYKQNNIEAYQELRKEMITILEKLDQRFDYQLQGTVGYKLGVSGVSHQSGTCRFGNDPATSVLDLNCKAHDLSNLYVVDTSFFPSSGAVNPSLTAIANALRVGDHLIKKWEGTLQTEQPIAAYA